MMPGQFLAGGAGLWPMAPIRAVTEEELPGIIRELKGRLRRRPLRRMAPQLWSATYILMGLRYSPAVVDVLLQGVVSMEESSTYQAILAKGKAEGKVEGAVAEAQRLLLLLATNQFGEPPARIRLALEPLTDLERLEALTVRVTRVKGWDELLDLPSPARRTRRNGS